MKTLTHNIIWLLYSIALICLMSCGAQNTKNLTSNSMPSKSAEGIIFPDDWLGIWEGELEIIKFDTVVQRIPMALEHARMPDSDSLTWAIIYGEDKVAGRRDYILTKVDPASGHYRVDEQNGILLDSYIFKNEMISTFEVMGNLITSMYRHTGDAIIFEIIMSRHATPIITGDTVMNGDTIPAVQVFPTMVKQQARLTKVE